MSDIFTIIPATEFRNTDQVQFHFIPLFENLKGMDLVKHGENAISPGTIGETERPWYMHPHQIDNLIVFIGTRYVDLFLEGDKEISSLEVTPEKIIKDGKLLYEGPAVLSWGTNVFHRIKSGAEGSYSLNFAVREEGFDIKNNFNIYDLNTKTGEYKVVRDGFKDQKNA